MKSSPQPLPYTASPTGLAIQDLLLFLRITFVWPPGAGIPSVVLPFYPFHSGKLDELFPDYGNLKAIVLHLILIVCQSLFLVTLIPSILCGVPVLPLSWAPVCVGWIFGFVFANKYFCILLNGTKRHYQSQIWREDWEEHNDEKWIFINGVAVGDHWMQSNLDKLALTFRRRIYGIHNQTRGIIFDVIECIIQRTFGYATPDIRIAYKDVLDTIEEDGEGGERRWKKIVLILHSQGAVEGGLVLDWLFATVERSLLERIEVYTFGCAANHFNSPTSECQAVGRNSSKGSRDSLEDERRVIKYIEHYANLGDYVSLFGILHFRPLPRHPRYMKPNQMEKIGNRYVGRLFVRKGSGHQMNRNYLDNYFAMDSDSTAVLEDNDFMSSEVNQDLVAEYDVVSRMAERDVWECQKQAIRGKKAGTKVKDISRLWCYRNGGSPKD
ncbi:hypothetical protein H2198_000290 [Neophaeococcomyces mojaviensis]|uniref:Uncharacterized protein n=1 Tax=Neophaeococcomyces mojaviensis TaxID=3383035 RepID=A0ACC3AKA6_9EURO|nr:hypothetical protein H2198_000290 [Knufia sp. JES_112]